MADCDQYKRSGRHIHTHRATLVFALCVVPVLLASCGAPQMTGASAAIEPSNVTATAGALLAPTNVPTRTPVPPTSTPEPTAEPTVVPTLPAPTRTPLSLRERQALFSEVWEIINSRYLYDNFNGVDWEAVRDRYMMKIATTESDTQFYSELTEMVALLNDEHSRFLPPAMAVYESQVVSGRSATVGIGIVTVPSPDGALVQFVFPNSPAARAGLRPRDRIIAVDGHPYQSNNGNLEGLEGSTVRLNTVRPGERPRDLVLERQQVQGRIVPYYRRFAGDIGYVWISTLWVDDMDEQVNGALTELIASGPINGLVLDLRGNPGGWRHVLSGTLSHFVRGQVGKFFDREQVQALVVSAPAGPDLRNMPLVVLIDENTASYAEVLAAVLQYEAGAQVVGTPSAGNTESIYGYTLKDGSRLWLAQEGFRLQNNVDLEGTGVRPDVLLDVRWQQYSEEDDPQLLEALRILGGGAK